MASVKLKDIFKKYADGPTVINHFNLEVDDNELVVLLGPSGCGKTTILRLICGLEPINSGEIYISNKLVNEVHPRDRDIAMVFQNHALYPHMSIYDNMAISLKQKKMDDINVNKRILEAAKILEIENILKFKPTGISSGQAQRVAIGRAIVRNPKVFLMDEPLAGLDAHLKYQMRDEILRIQQNLQTAMIYVTHDQRDAMAIGSRIVVMKDGFIQQVDTPQDIYDNPTNYFVAGFIGYPQMNFFIGDIRQMGDEIGISFNSTYIAIPKVKTKNILAEGSIKRIILGIRPENIHIVDSTYQNPNGLFESKVDFIERVGSESHIKASIAGVKITIRVSSNIKLNIGDNILVALNLNKIHLFNPETHHIISS